MRDHGGSQPSPLQPGVPDNADVSTPGAQGLDELQNRSDTPAECGMLRSTQTSCSIIGAFAEKSLHVAKLGSSCRWHESFLRRLVWPWKRWLEILPIQGVAGAATWRIKAQTIYKFAAYGVVNY